MRIIPFFLVASIALSACAPKLPPPGTPLRPGDVALTSMSKAPRLASIPDMADASTTAYGLWTNVAKEANPILAWSGDAAPLVAIPLKYGMKVAYIKAGHRPYDANVSIETGSSFAACANLVTLTGASIAPALAIGIVCAILYRDNAAKKEKIAFDAWQAAGSPDPKTWNQKAKK